MIQAALKKRLYYMVNYALVVQKTLEFTSWRNAAYAQRA